MQAIAQDTYGTAAVLHPSDIAKPAIGEHDVLDPRPRGRRQHRRLGDHERPAVHRPPGLRPPQAQEHRPRHGRRRGRRGGRRRGHPLQGRVTRSSAGRTARTPSTASRTRTRSRSSPPTSPSRRPPPCRWPASSPSRPSATTARSGPARGPRQRRVGRDRHVRGPDRQGARRRGHGRHQHPQPRARPLARRRPRHRLHDRGLHPGRRAVRPHPRQRLEPFPGRPAPRPDPDRDAHPERRPLRQPLAGQRRPHRARGRAVPAQRPDARQLPDRRPTTPTSRRSPR